MGQAEGRIFAFHFGAIFKFVKDSVRVLSDDVIKYATRFISFAEFVTEVYVLQKRTKVTKIFVTRETQRNRYCAPVDI